jgi:uncharacterized protein YkwD
MDEMPAAAGAGLRARQASDVKAAIAFALLALVNSERARHHVPPVRSTPKLSHCTEFRPMRCLGRLHVRSRSVGVITAWKCGSLPGFVHCWLASPSHRQIMLDPSYRLAGAAVEGSTARVVFAA